jgi:HKD family nuclease
MKAELIRNTSEPKESHYFKINELLKRAEEIHIAVAFLKTSGLNLIEPAIEKAIKRNVPCRIVAGLHFGLTEPIALRAILNLFKKSTSQLFLARNTNNEVFHPKIYLIRIGKTAHIITGSANLTTGGLQNNFECSMWIETNTSDVIWKDSLSYFDELCTSSISNAATKELIDAYEVYFREQRNARKGSRATPQLEFPNAGFSYNKLIEKFKQFNNSNRNKDFDYRTYEYSQARRVLNKIISTKNLSNNEFCDLIDELAGGSLKHSRYWHSNGLSRNKAGKQGNPGIYQTQDKVIELVRFVKSNKDRSEKYVFETGMMFIQSIPFAGVNFLTEIMMTYNPQKFPNLNNNPLKVLNEYTSLTLKKNKQSYTGNDYANYCNYVREINEALGLRNMLEADSFFNWNYQKIKKANKK